MLEQVRRRGGRVEPALNGGCVLRPEVPQRDPAGHQRSPACSRSAALRSGESGAAAGVRVDRHVPGASQQGARCAGEDLQVEAQRAMLDVPDVQLDPLLPRDPGAAVDLGPPGDAGAQVQAAQLARRVELDLGGQRRPRADDPHVAAKHVEEVRQLVEREPAQQPADPCHPRVLGGHRRADADRIGALAHGPQLEHLEDHAVAANAPLPVDHRPARAELDRDRRGQQDRETEDQRDHRDRKVGPARQSLPGAGRGRRHVQALLSGVRHGAVGAAHRVPSTFSQPIGTEPARRRSQSPTAIEAVTVT